MEEYDKHLKELSEQDKNRLTVAKAKQLIMDRASMIAHDYVVDVPAEEGGTIPTEEGGHKKCERCNADYIVHGNMTEVRFRVPFCQLPITLSDSHCRRRRRPAFITGVGWR
jgi:hypothetical protein